jgi:hypothetical protein
VSTNVVDFPSEEPPELLIGPFQVYHVIVDGRRIPRLTGHPDGDKIMLIVDGRFGASFSKDQAYGAATLIAQALAVASGYAHLGAETKDQPFAPLSIGITAP